MAVYFFEDELTQMIKVGRSDDLALRFQVLQQKRRAPLFTLGIIHVHLYAEVLLHKRFVAWLRGNEWYAPNEDLYLFILEHGIQELPSPEHRIASIERVTQRLGELKYPFIQLVRALNEARNEIERLLSGGQRIEIVNTHTLTLKPSKAKLSGQVLAVIDQYLSEKGYPPTVRDIAEGVGISTSSVVRYLHLLEADGAIEYRRKLARGIRRLVTALPALPVDSSKAA